MSHLSNFHKSMLLAALVGGTGWLAAQNFGENGPFGIGSCHVNGRSVDDYERWMPEMEAAGIRTNRSLMSHWGAVEPEEGQWNWENVDAQWQYLHDRGMITGTLLIGNTGWNKLDPPGHMPVNNIEGWSEYVRQLVGHFKGRITDFEVWNEPPNFTGPYQTPADYAKLVAASYDAAKEANPEARVGLTAKSAHIQYLREVIRAGAKDKFDWISLHPYEVLGGIVDDAGAEVVYLNIVPTVRKMLAEENPAKKDVPIVFTELGVDTRSKGDETQAHALVKAYVLGIAQGVANIQWFEGRDGDSGPMGLLDGERKPRPAYDAYKRMIEVFGEKPAYLGWVLLDTRITGFLFETPRGPVMAAWTPGGEEVEADFGASVEYVNATTGKEGKGSKAKVGTAPLFVGDLPASLVQMAKENRGKLLPWPGDDGDYSDADKVEIDFSKDRPERGLHNRSGESLAKDIVTYGGNARAGDAPGGSIFNVDPAFLCYDRVPIEITVEVKRKEPAKNAGFKLVYESPSGFSTADGWKTIPEDDQWHTFTWRIDDPMFVSYWGYNFRLESDGNVYNQYLLRKIEVKKVKGE